MNTDKQTILHKEIDLIQECIKRMANNSFFIKGWTLSLIAVVLALTNDKIDLMYICLILFIPILSFWYLDAFFLRTEKMYRKMYEWVIKNRPVSEERMYELDPRKYIKDVESIKDVMLSPTLKVFFGIPILILLFIILCTLFGILFFPHCIRF